VAIFGIFSCNHIGGVWLLDSDARIQCYTRKHWGYLGAGVIWVFVFTVGIPVFFISLLHHLRVPHLAKQLADNAWLREVVKLAWMEGMAQPTEHNLLLLTTDTITEAHLEALHAFLMRGVSSDHANNILTGEEAPPAEDWDEAAPPPAGIFAPINRRWQRIRASWLSEEAVPAGQERKNELLARLLTWAQLTGVINIPPLEWEEDDDKEEEDVEAKAALFSKSRSGFGRVLQRRLSKVSSTESQTKQRQVALRKVGFLFVAFKPQHYYWEVVELGRKLALTSVLALIAPGTAGQVVVGLLLALFMLLLNLRIKPYASPLLNNVNVYAQLNLVFFLLVALLLKVNLDEEGNAYFYTGIVGFLAIVPAVLPVLILIYAVSRGDAFREAGDMLQRSSE